MMPSAIDDTSRVGCGHGVEIFFNIFFFVSRRTKLNAGHAQLVKN